MGKSFTKNRLLLSLKVARVRLTHSLSLSCSPTLTHAHRQTYRQAGRGAPREYFEPFRRWPWTCDRERRLPMTADTHTHRHTHAHTLSRVGSYKGNKNNNNNNESRVYIQRRFVLCDENLDLCLGPGLGLGLLQLLALPTHPHTHARTQRVSARVLRIRIRICLTPHNIAHVSDARPWDGYAPLNRR